MLGLTYASLYPQRVKTLVLVGCGAYDELAREEYKRRLRESLGDEGWARYDDLYRRMLVAGDPEWKDALLRQIGELIERAQSLEPVGMTSADTTPDADGYFETRSDVIRLQREGIEPARFSAIQCPVLMVHGEKDPHPGNLIRDSLQVHIPQLAYIGIHGCGHVPWYERFGREHFFGTLKQWIGELG